MSTTETPPPAESEPQPTGRQCPRCGAPMTEEQEWCLRCGAAVGARVVAAPGWRVPIAIASAILAVTAIAVVVAIVTLADDTDQVAQTPAAVQPSPTAPPASTPTPSPDPAFTPDPTLPEASGQETPTPAPTPSATPSATPEATSTPDQGASGAAAEWPAGKSGWTVVLSSDTSRSTAEDKAADFAADGIADVGVLNSDDFSSLKSGFWVVFSGQYDSQSEASDALDGVDAPDAYIRRIVPN